MRSWSLAGLAVLLLSLPPQIHAQTWQPWGVGDCNGSDTAFSPKGISTPEPGRCNAQVIGTTAVCWDGQTHRNSGGVFCAYKAVTPGACAAAHGGSPGTMWECAR